jgi:hypothetical protein
MAARQDVMPKIKYYLRHTDKARTNITFFIETLHLVFAQIKQK